MRFRYVGYMPKQGVRTGIVEAFNKAEAEAEVTRLGYRALKITSASRLPSVQQLFPSLFQVKKGEVARFAREMSTMLFSGISILRALDMVENSASNGIMRRTVADLRMKLEGGDSLSSGMARHPALFSPLFVSVVQVGESTGRLAPALQQIGDILTMEHEAKQKATQALMYPVAVLGLSLITLTVLMTTALPSLVKVFEQTGAEIPLMTRFALGLGTAVREHILQILGGVAIGVAALALLLRFPSFKYRVDAFKTRLPVVGPLSIMAEVARASRALAMLLDAGVPLVGALRLVINGCGNLAIRKAFITLRGA